MSDKRKGKSQRYTYGGPGQANVEATGHSSRVHNTNYALQTQAAGDGRDPGYFPITCSPPSPPTSSYAALIGNLFRGGDPPPAPRKVKVPERIDPKITLNFQKRLEEYSKAAAEGRDPGFCPITGALSPPSSSGSQANSPLGGFYGDGPGPRNTPEPIGSGRRTPEPIGSGRRTPDPIGPRRARRANAEPIEPFFSAFSPRPKPTYVIPEIYQRSSSSSASDRERQLLRSQSTPNCSSRINIDDIPITSSPRRRPLYQRSSNRIQSDQDQPPRHELQIGSYTTATASAPDLHQSPDMIEKFRRMRLKAEIRSYFPDEQAKYIQKCREGVASPKSKKKKESGLGPLKLRYDYCGPNGEINANDPTLANVLNAVRIKRPQILFELNPDPNGPKYIQLTPEQMKEMQDEECEFEDDEEYAFAFRKVVPTPADTRAHYVEVALAIFRQQYDTPEKLSAMSLAIQDVLNDAKKLSNRLSDHDSTADALVSQMQAVYQQVEAMKQYHEDISQLNDLASERPRLALVAGIQQESKHITDLQQENRELRVALEEQQNAVDMIMSKYREHVSKLMECRRLDDQLLNTIDTNNKALESSAEKMNEMKFIMRKSISLDEEAIVKEEALLSRLWAENKGLREMLEISKKYGSYGSSLINQSTEDKEVQTSS